jgi:hypothetical protein
MNDWKCVDWPEMCDLCSYLGKCAATFCPHEFGETDARGDWVCVKCGRLLYSIRSYGGSNSMAGVEDEWHH